MSIRESAEKALEQGKGILRLAPNWVPRVFCTPGRRIKLHPDDYYALGGNRGGLDERWFVSTVPADNGPLTAPNEGLSFVVLKEGTKTKQVLFGDVVNELKDQLIGKRLWETYGSWPMFAKFFDNQDPLPFHLHHTDKYARLVNRRSKHEAYYFPPQVNNHVGDFPFTFFGFQSGVTKEQVRECLENFSKGDNKITNLSKAYRLELGTGWDVPPGVLHAPGTLCTYEPQEASDIHAMVQSLITGRVIEEEHLWGRIPEDKRGDVDFFMGVIDWDLNFDPDFRANRLMRPRPVKEIEEMQAEGYIDKWICYKSDVFSAKELSILPRKTVTINDSAAYGFIVVQGYGTMNDWKVETPILIRYGQLTNDEFFVSESAAKDGVVITNQSETEPLVMLKHFGPGNPDL
ncbi:MAG: hypothetical protein HWN65_00260 [Candidatus Helarchaeota archaeon]|nr:hypothetical protein [Candidatus Helarchaeota archaeon]